MIRQFPFSQVQHLLKCVRIIYLTVRCLCVSMECVLSHSVYAWVCVCVEHGEWEAGDIEMG